MVNQGTSRNWWTTITEWRLDGILAQDALKERVAQNLARR